jgi:serine/threonine protein kinase
MPLEQFGGRTVAASDLYSLGATLIYLVTGTHPADLPHKDGQIEFEQAANLTAGFSNCLRWMTQPSLDKRLTSADKALQVLEQQRQRDIDPSAVRRLAGSKVLLTKNADFLEILIPPKGFSCQIVALSLWAIPWSSVLFFMTTSVLSNSFPGNLIAVLFLLPFWGGDIGMVWVILFALFGRLRLRLNHQQISLSYELFRFKSGSRPAPRQDISKLVLIYSAEGNPQTIAIWAGTQEYQLGCLTALELDWLAHELSDWLRLPIQVRKLPPVAA